MKNFMKVNGKDLIVLVQKRNGGTYEYVLDKEDYHLLEGKSLYIPNKNGDLCFSENGRHMFVKDLIMNQPKTRVSHIDGNNRNLRKTNLCTFGIRNVRYVEGNTLVVEIMSKGKVVRALFDADMKDVLDMLDCKFTLSNGYVYAIVEGKNVRVHRYIAEKHLGKDALEGKVVDHLLGLKLDNRISQLRLLTHAENSASRHTTRAIFPNVYLLANGTYQVRFGAGSRFNKTFKDEAEACRYAYAVRPFSFDQETYVIKRHETVGSIENLKKALTK